MTAPDNWARPDATNPHGIFGPHWSPADTAPPELHIAAARQAAADQLAAITHAEHARKKRLARIRRQNRIGYIVGGAIATGIGWWATTACAVVLAAGDTQ